MTFNMNNRHPRDRKYTYGISKAIQLMERVKDEDGKETNAFQQKLDDKGKPAMEYRFCQFSDQWRRAYQELKRRFMLLNWKQRSQFMREFKLRPQPVKLNVTA